MLTWLRAAGPSRQLGAGLLLLALALQVFAPAAGLLTRGRAAELAAADALTHFVICGQILGMDSAATLPGPAPTECDRCPFCRCTAVPPLPVPLAPVIRQLTWHRVVWPIPPPFWLSKPTRLTAQARAPPQPV